jgi:undecaprenyl-diphosphatase
MDFLKPFDQGLLYFQESLHRSSQAELLDRVMWGITEMGDLWALLPAMAVLALVFGSRRRYVAMVAILIGPLGAWVAAEGVKRLVDRDRPDQVWRVGPLPQSKSFPSGHATRAMSVYALAGLLLARRLRGGKGQLVVTGGILLGVLVGVSRVYLGVHWPTDVLAGWALGLGWALVVANVVERREAGASVRDADGWT